MLNGVIGISMWDSMLGQVLSYQQLQYLMTGKESLGMCCIEDMYLRHLFHIWILQVNGIIGRSWTLVNLGLGIQLTLYSHFMIAQEMLGTKGYLHFLAACW